MSGRRVDMHRVQELVRLHRQGLTVRAIARTLKMGRDTARGYLAQLADAGLLEGSPEDLPSLESVREATRPVEAHSKRSGPISSVDPWSDTIARLVEKGVRPTAIHDHLRCTLPDEYTGTVSSVKRLCTRLRKARGVKSSEVTMPVETEAGEVAQVDFGYAGKRYDPEKGVLRKSWVFVMVLGFSRKMVAYLVFDQSLQTWLKLHVRAFAELRGVPRVIVPDNLKAAVVRAAFGVTDEPQIHRSYRELARHYGFRIDPTPPRSPQMKGKVESGVKYVRRNGLATIESVDLPADQAALDRWLERIANARRHGTTRRVPEEVFAAEEKSQLLPLPERAYELVLWKKVKLHRDCHVQIDRAFYSAPWKLVHEELWACCRPQHVTLYHQDLRVADHRRVPAGKRSTKDEHLPQGRSDLRHRSRAFWEERAGRIGPKTERMVEEIFGADDVLHRLRAVQALVTHLEQFPTERAERACTRALRYGCTTYIGVRNILRAGLDLVPDEPAEPRPWLQNARFARKPGPSLQGDFRWQSRTS